MIDSRGTWLLISILLLLSILLITSCNEQSTNKHDLVENLYFHAKLGNKNDSALSFISLANIALNSQQIEQITSDYSTEKNSRKRYYYTYLLAKRTQEEKYIIEFIERSKNHTELLTTNPTQWVSIASPFYQLLSTYSRTNNKALAIILSLASKADGVYLAFIADDIKVVYQADPQRVIQVMSQNNISQDFIETLLIEE